MMFTSDIVARHLVSLNPYKVAGPDGLHPKVLRTLAPFLVEPRAELFNLSLLTADVPEDWRTATICPQFKKGDRESASNYRPVSLTSLICKVMESVMKEAVMSHLLRTVVLSDAQHGLVPKRSCLTNLLLPEQ